MSVTETIKQDDSITIMLIEDHALIRDTWSYIFNLNAKFSVIGACGNGEEGVKMAEALKPQVILMDINLPGTNGFETTALIHNLLPLTKIIGVSKYSDPSYARKIMKNGGCGYVTKTSSTDELYRSILDVSSGIKYICSEVKNNLAAELFSEENLKPGLNCLSKREKEIMSFVKVGNSSRQISELLDISIKTVELHRYNIFKKLNIKNSAGLVNYINNLKSI